MAKEQTTLSLDADVKAKARELFSELGMDLSTAVNIFLRQAVYEHSVPFSIYRDIPNAETRAALEEGDRMLSDPGAKKFRSVDELFADLEDE